MTEPDINNRLESLCLSMTEHALGGESSSSHVTAHARLGAPAVCCLHSGSNLEGGQSTSRGRQETGREWLQVLLDPHQATAHRAAHSTLLLFLSWEVSQGDLETEIVPLSPEVPPPVYTGVVIPAK